MFEKSTGLFASSTFFNNLFMNEFIYIIRFGIRIGMLLLMLFPLHFQFDSHLLSFLKLEKKYILKTNFNKIEIEFNITCFNNKRKTLHF